MRARTRPVLLMLLIAFQTFSLIGILIAARAQTEAVMLEHARSVMAHVGETVADKTQSFLAPAERTAELTRGLLETGALDETRLEPYLLEQLRINPQLTGAYLGKPDGSFVFVLRDGAGFRTKRILVAAQRRVNLTFRDAQMRQTRQTQDPSDRYNPRSRPWYQAAITANGTVWTNPYVFFTSKQPGVTAATPVRDRDGKLLGVVGVDIEISGLSAYLGRVPISANGRSFIVNTAGTMIAAPGLQTFASGELPKLMQEGSLEARALMMEFKDRSLNAFDERQFTQSGAPIMGSLESFSIGHGTTWLLGVYAPRQDFIGSLEPIGTRYVLEIVLVFAITCALAVPVAFGAWNPLVQLERHATLDGLTGLPNRAAFLDRAQAKLNRARQRDQVMAVAMLDLDGFKTINDTHGHAVGDEVLGIIGQRIRASVRRQDLAGRVGGDEFAFVIPCHDTLEAERQIERVRDDVFNQPFRSSAGLHHLSATVGLTVVDHDVDTRVLLDYLTRADQALLGGKRGGKNRVVQA